MTVEQPHYLWLLLGIPIFAIASYFSYQNASAWLYRFAHIRKRPLPYLLTTVFLSLALCAVILALAEPKVQYTKTVFNRSGIDVAIGIDVSKSMLAEDEALPEEDRKLFAVPNRLNRARCCALNIISALRGERAAVFMFASKGVSIVPLTNDYGYCDYILKHFNDATITIPGSDLGQAITTGLSLLEGSPRKTVKSMVLISDGEDITGDSSAMYQAAQRAAGEGVAVYTVGTGMGQGVLIPIRSGAGTGIEGYYQDEDGSVLKTRMEPETLKGVATATGGGFFRAGETRIEERIVDAILKRARTMEYTKATEPAWYPLAPALLGAALLFFMLSLITGR
ncbi:VWA domain-containing protein [Geomonas sp. RF6]|uniref:vWA domain-containing protein n=1 Tax=Geomonas sp. RF6 TaxID=2897342 RepID=UPI001E461891|nr:VWA domain-containing protein [Geomonas sp. RF6]UFS70952.1 VWA domain-containing protein [Geomonas sp. RF6]